MVCHLSTKLDFSKSHLPIRNLSPKTRHTSHMSHQNLIVCLSIVLFNLQDKVSVQGLKLGFNDQPYDSTVDKLCGQFASDRDQMQSHMQGLSYRAHDYDYQKGDFYLAYHDHLYSWQMTDMETEESFGYLALWPFRPKTVDFKSVDPLKALGKWNEISWLKPILDANGVDGNGVKLIRFRIYARSGPDVQSQIEISFQRNGRHQVDTLLANNETGVAELRQDYMPECAFSGIPTDKTYIFRYDDKGQVVVSWRQQQDSTEEGPFYMYTERNSKYPDSYCSLQFHSTSPPPKAYSSYIVHTPLFTQLPIYGLIGGYVHLWDLPNHRVYYFMHSGQYNRLNNVSFEKYFDCPVESTTSGTSQEGPTLSIPSQEEISKHPQGEPGQQFLDESNSQATVTQSAPTQSNIWLYIVLCLLGLAVLLGLCVFLARRHKRKQRLSKLKAKMMRTKANKRTKGKKSSSQVSPSKSSSISLSSSTSNKSAISSGKSGSNVSKSGLKTKTPIATSKTSSRVSK